METERRCTVPLAAAAQRLGWPWARAFDAILTGRLAGQRRGGRWYVCADALDRLAGELVRGCDDRRS